MRNECRDFKRRCQDNTKIDLKEIGYWGVKWFREVQDRD
jgi:hypothetical protein